MRVLVTGGAGFIGSHIAAELLRRGYTVRILDDYSTGRAENIEAIRDDLEVIDGTVESAATAAAAVKGCEAVFHQASIPSVARSLRDPVATNSANVTGTVTMLAAARDAGVRRFIYAASSSAYGDNPILPKREDMAPMPRSPYAVAKLAGEQYCQVFGRLFEIETICLRYFNVFGPGQDPSSPYSAVIPAFARALLIGEPLRLNGDGKQSRDFTYIDNAVQANLAALTAPGITGEVVNIACGESYKLIELIDELERITGLKAEVQRFPPAPGDVSHSLADISKARRLLGYVPVVDFAEGLRRTVAWLRDAVEKTGEAANRV